MKLQWLEQLGGAARQAARALAGLSDAQRNRALGSMAASIRACANDILQANAADLAAATAGDRAGPMLDRLRLDAARIAAMAEGIESVAALADPLGRVLAEWTRPNGLQIRRVAVPIGVIGVIFESRPNVGADAAALCLKSGNAVILRGGSEAAHSNQAIYRAVTRGLAESGLSTQAVQMLPTQDHAAVSALLGAHQWVDLVVPRGGRRLVERVRRDARVPVLAHLDGNNHLYVHADADPQMALALVVNAKMRRPGICGALETLLLDRACLELLPALADRLTALGCELRGDPAACARDARIRPATAADWDTEYLDSILAIRTVEGLDEAMAHIARHGSGHTDAIVTDDESAARRFLDQVDSAIVLHNASTQFADGGEFGFGAEIGIATGRLHARGPVGVEQLTTAKYQVRGSGQIRP